MVAKGMGEICHLGTAEEARAKSDTPVTIPSCLLSCGFAFGSFGDPQSNRVVKILYGKI